MLSPIASLARSKVVIALEDRSEGANKVRRFPESGGRVWRISPSVRAELVEAWTDGRVRLGIILFRLLLGTKQ